MSRNIWSSLFASVKTILTDCYRNSVEQELHFRPLIWRTLIINDINQEIYFMDKYKYLSNIVYWHLHNFGFKFLIVDRRIIRIIFRFSKYWNFKNLRLIGNMCCYCTELMRFLFWPLQNWQTISRGSFLETEFIQEQRKHNFVGTMGCALAH